MTTSDDQRLVDRDRVRELFDLRGASMMRGKYEGDPYLIWHRLREEATVHPGVLHELTGYHEPAIHHGLPYPERTHFTVFTFEACDEAYRNPELFASSPEAVAAVDLERGELGPMNSILSMGGAQHRRYRGLVQPSFMPAAAEWWIRNWIESTVDMLIDGFVADGHADLNVDFCAVIPVLTITGSFGVPVDRALDIRASFGEPQKVLDILSPVIAARREEPRDDLISVLVQAELTDDDRTTHRLTDAEIASFSILLLQAGSGTTWRQMGNTLVALLERPDVLRAVRDDRSLVKPAVEEALRWQPNLPMFSRWVTRDVDFHGAHIPEGAIVHLGIGPANRDPARWERPDDYDLTRPMKPSLAFGSGPHVCLGMHVARAEMTVGLNALLDRLPNLRLDPDAAPPEIMGMYERGPTELPVVFG
jgi:cytochrome P450